MELTVEGPETGQAGQTGEFRWTIGVDHPDSGLASSLSAALAEIGQADQADRATAGGRAIQLWIREVDEAADTAAVQAGFVRFRDLWQLRCSLPAAPSGLATRGFTDADLDDFVRVNNRAFHWHPEQGGLTADAVRATMAEPWFDPDGFRLLHHDESGDLIGFCWTKVHAEHDPPLGEIYVIAVDPSQHGRGLGKPMTLAGLEWLSDHDLEHGMLYVESDNDPANATYERIGFIRHHTDRAYRLDRLDR